MKDSQIITHLGGPTAVAKLLGLPGERASQRVHNWKSRGIPAQIKLDYPYIFQRYIKQAYKNQRNIATKKIVSGV
jgi:hypothetical protein